MKSGIHPQLFDTKVHCNGCGTDFVTRSTVESITVEICSSCHPFYTGKQKLVDTAGRVEKFEARRKAAEAAKSAGKKKPEKTETPVDKSEAPTENDPELNNIAEELVENTVDQPVETPTETEADTKES